MNKERLEYLFSLYLLQSATPEEEEELMKMLTDDAHEAAVKSIIGESWKHWEAKHLLTQTRSQAIYNNLLQRVAGDAPGPGAARKVKRFRPWLTGAAAAAILLLGMVVYFAVQKHHTPEPVQAAVTRDVAAPAAAHAVLTLANGTRLVLDSAGAGSLAVQGKARVVKLANGRIAYHAPAGRGSRTLYNTLTVPRGSRIMQLVLGDGTKVWLNAGSSVRYPAAFTGRERNVSITGEAYFEVAPDAARPFTVHVRGMQVLVLGTHFNINAYTDEPAIKTTLLQGSIRVSGGDGSRVLYPGEQARVGPRGHLELVQDAGTEEAVAWKNGFFSFHEADIREVMRQLSRWYDMDVSYKGAIPAGTFSGEIGRDLSLQKVLSILKKTRVHFKIEADKKIVIMP